MKRVILVLVLLVSFISVCSAQLNTDCFNECQSQRTGGENYCKQKCSRIQQPYEQQSLDLQRQQIELQKQSLELQKQTLELQKQQIELQKQLQPSLEENNQNSLPSNS